MAESIFVNVRTSHYHERRLTSSVIFVIVGRAMVCIPHKLFPSTKETVGQLVANSSGC